MTDAPDALVIDKMRRRVRALRALRGAVEYTVWGLALASITVLGARLGHLPAGRAKVGLALAAVFPLLGAALSAARSVPSLLAAQLLDRHYGLHDRLSSALEFRATPPGERSPWMSAAIDDAATQARERSLEPSKALTWRWPSEARVALGLVGVLALVAFAHLRIARVVHAHRPASARAHDALVLEDDDLQAFRELSRELARNAVTPASRDTLRDFDRFLDDVARQRLDRQEAFRRLAALQQTLDEGVREDHDALRETLSDMGQRMGDRSEQARELSQSLQQGDLQRAHDAMQRLADHVRQEHQMSAQQRQELARALQQAAEQRNDPELQRRLEQARREVEEMLRRQREHQLSQGDQDLLRRRQRESEQLQRQSERNEQLRREVEHLQREIAEAARNLPNDPAQAGQNLQQGAEQLSRMEEEQRSRQSLDELRQRLEELREQMRQQNGQNGQRQRSRVARFARSAMGRGGQRGQSGPQGAAGGGQQGNQQGGRGEGGAQGEGGNGQGGAQGEGGTQGQQAQGGANGQPGGMAGMQQGTSGDPTTMVVQQTQPGARGQPGGQSEQGGGAGAQHSENARGSATQTAQANQTMQVHGQQTGNGPSRSQVIRSAAADGFASAPYRQVYTPYWDHAREVLHQGEVPAGYRSYVRRYFQLIRPRDEQ